MKRNIHSAFYSLLLIMMMVNVNFMIKVESAQANFPRGHGDNKWHNHSSVARGHEDLVRMAVETVNKILRQQEPHHWIFPEVPYGEAGVDSKNPLIRGNFSTDFADEIMRARYLPGSSEGDDIGSHPSLQHLHFLRNYENDVLWSSLKTCQEGKKLIYENTLHAFKNYDMNPENENSGYQFFYWIGHVTHTIQDAFSPAHVIRDNANPGQIKEICTWGKQFPEVCYHNLVDLDDRVWNLRPECLLGEGNRTLECLRDEAQRAVSATTEYLLIVARLAKKFALQKGAGTFDETSWKNTVDQELRPFFDNPNFPHSGFFICPNQ